MIEEVRLRVVPKVAATRALLEKEVIHNSNSGSAPLSEWRIVKRSIDARKRQIFVNLTVMAAFGEGETLRPAIVPFEASPLKEDAPVVAIVGAGPAGLFAALKAIQSGIRPIILERGKDVDSRRLDIANISREKRINPSSNYCFGEGGAGAYSDGKLFTRSKKRGNVDEVLQLLVAHGAKEDILIDSHPHIGSDKLPGVIKSIRNNIIAHGGDVRFETLVEKLIIENGRVTGLQTDKGDIRADSVILATGHSAHDTFRNLYSQGVAMEPKGIAIGVRLEHPQPLIDRLQYHSPEGRGRYLPAAEYSFVTQVEGRGVYSFCMCPGGVIVPAGSGEGELVVNGMSASARAGERSNSGMVVEIRPGDFPEYEGKGALQMLCLQEDLEKRMFEESGCTINAPAQRMEDFTKGSISETLPPTSYAPGIHSDDFNRLLPPFIACRLRQGFIDFGRKCHGFLTNDAILVGLESRTSSPIRIPRDRDSMEHLEIKGLFPAGEGAGYAGGIVSAAIDGMRCAEGAADFLAPILPVGENDKLKEN